MNLLRLYIGAITVNIFCLLQTVAQNENQINQDKVLDIVLFKKNKNFKFNENLKNIKKRSLMQILSEGEEVFAVENKSFNSTFLTAANTKDNRLSQSDSILEKFNISKLENVDIIRGNITSPEYPKPYPIPSSKNFSILLNPILDLELTFSNLDIRYQKDYIKITLNNVDHNKNPIVENSSTLVLSGFFNQRLVFYAKNYQYLDLQFKTSEGLSETTNSAGFILTYSTLKTNLSNTDGVLLPNTVTVLMSKFIGTATNPTVLVPGKFFERCKKSFCEAIDNISAGKIQRCDVQNVTQDLTIGSCPNENLTEIRNKSCLQFISATTMHYRSINFLTVDFNHNPHEQLLVFLAGIVGSVVILIIVTVALYRSKICGLKSKLCKNEREESTNQQQVVPVLVSKHNQTSEETHFCSKNSSCDRLTCNEESKSQTDNSKKAPCRTDTRERDIERF